MESEDGAGLGGFGAYSSAFGFRVHGSRGSRLESS